MVQIFKIWNKSSTYFPIDIEQKSIQHNGSVKNLCLCFDYDIHRIYTKAV